MFHNKFIQYTCHTHTDIDECTLITFERVNDEIIEEVFHDCHDGRADCINYDGGYNCSCYPEWSGGLNNGTNCTGKFLFILVIPYINKIP